MCCLLCMLMTFPPEFKIILFSTFRSVECPHTHAHSNSRQGHSAFFFLFLNPRVWLLCFALAPIPYNCTHSTLTHAQTNPDACSHTPTHTYEHIHGFLTRIQLSPGFLLVLHLCVLFSCLLPSALCSLHCILYSYLSFLASTPLSLCFCFFLPLIAPPRFFFLSCLLLSSSLSLLVPSQ
jgi:hypothetical protein